MAFHAKHELDGGVVMKSSLLRPIKERAWFRVKPMLAGLGLALALGAVTASSASAIEWWVGTPASPHPLGAGNKLPINAGGTVTSSVTFKWLKKFEVRCKGVEYDSLFLEGPTFLGATGIVFKECEAKKPKHGTLVGGRIETRQLTGKIKASGSVVEFEFEPVGGPTLTTFSIEALKKRSHRRASLHCTYAVSASGELSGELGDAEKITSEKTFDFASKSLVFKQSRTCTVPPGPSPRAKLHRRAFGRAAVSGLNLSTAKGPLAAGAELRASSSNVRFVSEVGIAECEENTLAGVLANNGASKDVATIAEATFSGNYEGVPGACKSEFGGTVRTNHLPWGAVLASSGKGELAGKPISVTAVFPGLECTYETGAIKALNSIRGPVTLTIANQALKAVAGSSTFCPKLAQINGTFALTSEGETVEAETAAGNKETEEEETEHAEEAAEEAEEEEPNPIEVSKGKSTYGALEAWGVL